MKVALKVACKLTQVKTCFMFSETHYVALIKKHATQIIEPRLVIGTREYTPCHFAFNAIKQTKLYFRVQITFVKYGINPKGVTIFCNSLNIFKQPKPLLI